MNIVKAKRTKRFIIKSGGLNVYFNNAWIDNSDPPIINLCDNDDIMCEVDEDNVVEFKIKFSEAGGILE